MTIIRERSRIVKRSDASNTAEFPGLLAKAPKRCYHEIVVPPTGLEPIRTPTTNRALYPLSYEGAVHHETSESPSKAARSFCLRIGILPTSRGSPYRPPRRQTTTPAPNRQPIGAILVRFFLYCSSIGCVLSRELY